MNELKICIQEVVVKLPEDYIIIEKQKYEKYKAQADIGNYLTLTDVSKMLNVSIPWLKEKILYNPTFKKRLDINLNPQGFVKYPKNQGDKYLFLASKTKAFFEEYFKEIFEDM
ncbi:TPA: DUF771 domain-containing protein [Streptococcus suis]